MILDFLREMLRTPDAHSDPYSWAATLMAHAMIGVALASLMPWWLAVAGYAVWEGAQMALYDAGWWDSLLDWIAVCLGVSVAVALMEGYGPIGAVLALGIVLIAGVGKRR